MTAQTSKMTFSRAPGVTEIKPHAGRPMGWRVCLVTGEGRPLTSGEIARMQALDERVRAANQRSKA